MHISHEVTTKLKKWPLYCNPTEVQGFLGTVGVVQRWIKDFAKIAKPLMLLTKKMVPLEFKWTPQAEEAMNTLKHLAANAIVGRIFLKYPEALCLQVSTVKSEKV